MKKYFIDVSDRNITDYLTNKRFGAFVDPKTYTLRFLPECHYKKVIKKKSFMRKTWEGFTKGIRFFNGFKSKKR